MKKNQWLSVSDLIEILQTMPKNAKVILHNSDMYVSGDYYATRDSVELFTCKDANPEVLVGTNYNTRAEED